MKPAGADRDVTDLTRWNRAGLGRIQYTAEGAAEFNEYLRLSHLLLYADGQDPESIPPIEQWQEAVRTGRFGNGTTLEAALAVLSSRFSRSAMDGMPPPNATWADRLLAQYEAPLTDPAAQIARAFARTLHVLAGTLDAYANEGFLRTATQPQHLGRLLALTGYRPRLAASAVMPLAYLLKPEAPRTLLPAGLAVEKGLPEDRGLLTFESLDPVMAHPALNAMRAEGWDQGAPSIAAEQVSFTLTGASAFSRSIVGSAGLLLDGASVEPVWIGATDRSRLSVTVVRGRKQSFQGSFRTARLRTGPDIRLRLRRRGRDWLNFAEPAPVSPGMILLAGPDQDGLSEVRTVRVEGRDVQVAPVSGQTLPQPMDVAFTSRLVFDPSKLGAENGQILRRINLSLRIKDQPLPQLRDLAEGYVHAEGAAASRLSASDVVVLSAGQELLHAQAVGTLTPDDGHGASFALTGAGSTPASAFTEVQAGFQVEAALAHDPRSPDPLAGPDGSIMLHIGTDFGDLIQPGRLLLLASDPDTIAPEAAQAVPARILRVEERQAATTRVVLDQPAEALASFRRGHAMVYGNVAEFGHGTSLPGRVLGSGDASLSSQVMTIDEGPISTRPNPAFDGGVAADIEITVEGQVWQQVVPGTPPGPDRPSYEVALTSAGGIEVAFRRLPTGTDNVVLSRVRTGAGALGNELAPLSVTNLQPKLPVVAAVVQPLAPQAGADLQDVEDLRQSGGRHFALMGRALSPGDFARLAEDHAGVWHAQAVLVRQGGGRGGPVIRLTVVPAGGGAVDAIRDDLVAMLEARSQPGTLIQLSPFESARFGGEAVVRLKPGYAAQPEIRAALEGLLEERFGLKARTLGQALYASEIAATIEGHPAVQSVSLALEGLWTDPSPRVELSASGHIQAIRPSLRMVAYLARAADLPLRIEALPGPRGF